MNTQPTICASELPHVGVKCELHAGHAGYHQFTLPRATRPATLPMPGIDLDELAGLLDVPVEMLRPTGVIMHQRRRFRDTAAAQVLTIVGLVLAAACIAAGAAWLMTVVVR
ncbi:hypothetical protein [Agromyces sp. S2-1-8]|uniref:hypothetical protein n=1 Tax=Agromyces sp. S2-1-8 TaxID=2897180 RepID=UPI001E373E7E|nr:hypothetical protein [Agromyces sp. S2-1-8]MCD5345063.1 hypothetical protein [Agromyces sp. S2-1-8]